ncbi:hypothetical protein [Pseudorhodobacter sp.]|uniref:hypothetical protein n=1 Tax=Pseudorhodobacter sp. TaxID=1934400 RepID=UPI002648E51A|nr:hypothetical protein [Pseudorhodobacter sp.]MDN5786975.1 hypothetical protein [Pseudorhodobacter sp.]
MSAPQTNLEKQKRWHRGPLLGIILAVAAALLLFVVYVAYVGAPADRGLDTGETVTADPAQPAPDVTPNPAQPAPDVTPNPAQPAPGPDVTPPPANPSDPGTTPATPPAEVPAPAPGN